MAIYWPPLTHRWYSGKNASGEFSYSDFKKVYSGNTLVETGHYVLNLFSKDRTGVSGIDGIDVDSTENRFSTIAAASGRIWYSGVQSSSLTDKVFFTRVIRNSADYGVLYQESDPTSEEQPDIVDTDGGEITVVGARGINHLMAFGSDVLVFARNGVWQITGIDRVFKPTAFAVIKLSDTGLLTPKSIVYANGIPVWWSQTGIYTVTSSNVTGELSVVSLSLSTIQTFWEEIDPDKRANPRTVYDKSNERVYWFYQNNDETLDGKFNKVLVFDLNLQAFFPWEIADTEDGDIYVVGAFFFDGSNYSTESDAQVVVGTDTVVIGSDNVTVASISSYRSLHPPSLKLLVRNTTGELTFGEFNGTDFLDWGTADYSSYAVTGYDFMSGGITLKKSIPYVTTYLGVTEDGFSLNSSGSYDLIDPSSCMLSAKWDFKTSFTTPRQIYKFKNPIVVNNLALGTFDSGYSVVATRNKLRGRGAAVIMKFESETGKDFNLLGYEIFAGVNRSF